MLCACGFGCGCDGGVCVCGGMASAHVRARVLPRIMMLLWWHIDIDNSWGWTSPLGDVSYPGSQYLLFDEIPYCEIKARQYVLDNAGSKGDNRHGKLRA
jgi:hypothetical protein